MTEITMPEEAADIVYAAVGAIVDRMRQDAMLIQFDSEAETDEAVRTNGSILLLGYALAVRDIAKHGQRIIEGLDSNSIKVVSVASDPPPTASTSKENHG